MDWLETILEKAKVDENGKLDVADLQAQIQKELPLHFVPKVNYNTKVTELKTANDTIKVLKDSNEDNEKLQKTVKEHEETIARLQKKNEDTVKTIALQKALSDKGCTDPDYVIYKQGGLGKFSFADDGNPIGIGEIIESYKENKVLFPTGKQDTAYNPCGGAGGPDAKNPFAKESFNLTEQGKLFREDPAKAKALASGAGVEI